MALLLAAGCQPPAECIPEEARAALENFYSTTAGPDAGQTAKEKCETAERITQVNIFLDDSGSMLGYVTEPDEKSGQEKLGMAYPKLLEILPAAAQSLAMDQKWFAFDENKKDLSDEKVLEYARIEKYDAWQSLRKEAAKGEKWLPYMGDTSNLPNVLAEIAKLPPNDMAVVVSDMFISGTNSQNDTYIGDLGGVTKKLGELINNDRTVAILGVSADFNGKVYDFPSMPKDGRRYWGCHPFYLLLIGREADVRGYYDSLCQLGLDQMAPEHHLLIFGPPPEGGKITAEQVDEWVQVACGGNATQTLGLFSAGCPQAPLDSFALSPGGGYLTVTPDLAKFRPPHRLPSVLKTVEARLWVRSDNQCPGAWREVLLRGGSLVDYDAEPERAMAPPSAEPVEPEPGPEGERKPAAPPAPRVASAAQPASFALLRSEQAQYLLRNYTYYLLLEIYTKPEGGAVADDQWWSRWSFSGPEGKRLFDGVVQARGKFGETTKVKPGAFFPTYNLKPVVLFLAGRTEAAQSCKPAIVMGMGLEIR